MELEDYESAVENFRRVIELRPGLEEGYSARGQAYESMEEFEKALVDYREALKINPNYMELKKRCIELENWMQTHFQFLETPKMDFSDVGGMEELKETMKKNIVYPLIDKDLAKEYGIKIGKGILLYGPPGCGKTYIMKAVAGECKVNFINLKISDILSMWVGNSEKAVTTLFQTARKYAPCIIFIDEIDALGGERAGFETAGWYRMTLDQLLTEMDGIEENEGVLVVGATNAPYFIDPALLRSGRFGKFIYVPPPDSSSRKEIFKVCMKGKPVGEIDYDLLAKMTGGFSSADIKNICDEAAMIPWGEALKTKKKRKINMNDLKLAINEKRPTLDIWYEAVEKQLRKGSEKIFSELFDDLRMRKENQTKKREKNKEMYR